MEIAPKRGTNSSVKLRSSNRFLIMLYFLCSKILSETPVYEGGMSTIIDFEAVVSNSASTASGVEEPLGSLASLP